MSARESGGTKGDAMPTNERGVQRRVAIPRAAVVMATVVAVGLAGCSSGSSKSNGPPVSSAPTSSVSATTTTAPRATGPNVIIDTDLSRWWDDTTAVGMANVLQQQGKMNILGIVSDVRNPVAVAAIDAIDTAYGHSSIPLGAVADSDANTAPHGYSDALAARLPHAIRNSDGVPTAVSLYRRLLAKQPDHSVTVVALGAYTNLAGLLASPGDTFSALDGHALVAEKVERMVIEDGVFPAGGPAFTNQKLDLVAASAVVSGANGVGAWPTPIAWVDGLDGIATRVGGTLCTTVPAGNPMRVVYEALFKCGPPGDGDWDGPTLLFAVDDSLRVFSVLGRGGAAVINAKGGLSWQTPSTRHGDVYVHVADQKALNQRINQLLVSR